MTFGPATGDTLQPPPRTGDPAGRSSRRIPGPVPILLALLVLAVCALGIRAVWPASSSARLVTETNDNGYFIVIGPAGEEVGSGSATQRSEEGDDVRVEVWGSLDPAGGLRVDATMANDSQSVLEFHGGLRMVVAATREGAPWRTSDIADPKVTELSPGETFAGHTTLDGAQGPAQFVLSATVDTWRR